MNMKINVTTFQLTTLLLLSLIVLSTAFQDSIPRHLRNRRDTHNSTDTVATTTSKCKKSCTLAIVGSVLTVFIICLIGSIYYATHQDKGQKKHQREWFRSIRVNQNYNPNRKPINLNQLESRLNRLAKPRNTPSDITSIDGSDNLGYATESYYNDSIHQEKAQNLYNQDNQYFRDMYDDEGFYSHPYNSNMPNHNQRRHNRILSAPDIYHLDNVHTLGPRAYSLDMDMNYEPEYRYGNGEDNRYPDNGYFDDGYLYPASDNRLDEGSYFDPASNNSAYNHLQPPNSDPMQRRALPSKKPLKSALKHSKSFQEMPLDQISERYGSTDDIEENRLGKLGKVRATFNRSRSLGVLDRQDYQPNYGHQPQNFHMTYDEQNNQHQYVMGRNADPSPIIDMENNTNYDNSDSYLDQHIIDARQNHPFPVLTKTDYDMTFVPSNEGDFVANGDQISEYKNDDDIELDKNKFHRSKDLLTRVHETKIRQTIVT